MFFVEITILSMLFSHAGGGGCQLGLKKISNPVPLSKFRLPLGVRNLVKIYNPL